MLRSRSLLEMRGRGKEAFTAKDPLRSGRVCGQHRPTTKAADGQLLGQLPLKRSDYPFPRKHSVKLFTFPNVTRIKQYLTMI